MGAYLGFIAVLVLATSFAVAEPRSSRSTALVWEKQELTFAAVKTFTNAYTQATVWVDLTGPHFKKRVYGFWDGAEDFRVRLVATEPGTWRWRSGSFPADPGVAGKRGSFEAIAWTDTEKQANPLRRGFLRAT